MQQRIVFVLILAAGMGAAAGVRGQDLERIPPGEAAAIGEIAASAVGELKKRYPENETALVRRDAHAKAHGCAKATFQVDANIPADLRVGTFSQPGLRYKAWIRFSNGSFEPGPDTNPDGRGMAIKIIDADPEGKPVEPRQRPPHDILMVNYPVFFLANTEDYKAFMEAGALKGDVKDLKRYFMPGYNPFKWHLRQAYIAYKNASQKIDSPLRVSYFSMTPYAFGAGRAVKYSVRPCARASAANVAPAGPGPDFLKTALQSELASAPACFELLVQERNGEDVEDATAGWSESVSPFRLAGRIEIPSQRVDPVSRETFCENLSFNPGNAPADLRPLGAINRARRVVYEQIAKYRFSRNKVSPADPVAAWDQF